MGKNVMCGNVWGVAAPANGGVTAMTRPSPLHSEAENAGIDLAISSMQRGTDARPIDATGPTFCAVSAAEHLQARASPS